MIGSAVGSVVDSYLVAALTPAQRIEGARLDSLRVTSSAEGAVIPRLYGRMRLGGNIIWATDFREEVSTRKVGRKGAKTRITEYSYFASFALALCEGPVGGIGRIWADGELMDTDGVTLRWHPGSETQAADPLIVAKMGADNAPAYRGTAYVVFEDLDVTPFGNRIPQINIEVMRPLADPDAAEGLIRAVTLIPGAGEFVYATEVVNRTGRIALGFIPHPEERGVENVHAEASVPDLQVALDRLEASLPAVESVSLVVAWFGDDLRAGSCTIRPKRVTAEALHEPPWVVDGVTALTATAVGRDDDNRPLYGGTPADFAVVQAIRELKARGKRVTFYPFLMMDVAPGNSKPDPYSDNAASTGQPVMPWRGRITCSPAAAMPARSTRPRPQAARSRPSSARRPCTSSPSLLPA